MKTKEIALRYNIDQDDFETFLIRKDLEYKSAFIGYNVDDALVKQYVDMYLMHLRQMQKKEEEKLAEESRKQQALAQMLISSGFSFEGYRIVKYSGYISGDDVTQIPRGVDRWFDNTLGKNGENLTNALVKIRRQALKELKEAAYNLGCNAVIGVDFDYITLEPETASSTGGTMYEDYVICVTANGNAVVIEKE